jgi:hypothetical protein
MRSPCAVLYLPAVEPLIQLPALPASHTISSSSTSSTNPASSSSSSTDPAAAPPARRRVLHVFWDVSSLHPGGYDPRVLVTQLRRVLGCYGDVAGVYAYGIQKLFNWIPESFMLQYAPDRLPGGVLATTLKLLGVSHSWTLFTDGGFYSMHMAPVQ